MSRGHIAETKFDLAMVIQELERARLELAGVDDGLYRYKREQALSSPLSRFELARRALAEALGRHGWTKERCKSRLIRERAGDPRQLWLALDLTPRARLKARVASREDARRTFPVKSAV